MSDKEPVILTVLIETADLRWYVAGVRLAGEPVPLLCSQADNLRAYLGEPFEEQLSFLRHRLSGVLQRGCDRLWGRQMKPCQIVFLADGPFRDADPTLTARLGEHFVEWMTRPPVSYLLVESGFGSGEIGDLKLVAGELEDPHRESLCRSLPAVLEAIHQPEMWELVPTKPMPNTHG
jgi:hypothetical protein